MVVKINELLKGLKKVKPGLNQKSVMLMATQDKRLMLQANDGACAASSIIVLEQLEEESEIYVDYNAFLNALVAVSRVSGSDSIVTNKVTNVITLQSGSSSINVPLASENDFSEIAVNEGPIGEVTVNGHVFKKALSSAIAHIGSVSYNVYLLFHEGYYDVIGTDGGRMGQVSNCSYVLKNKDNVELMKKIPIPEGQDVLHVVLAPNRATGIVSVLDDDDDVTIYFYEKCIACTHNQGSSLISVPLVSPEQAYLSIPDLVGKTLNVASEGETFELKKKEFINALLLLQCNVEKQEGKIFSFEQKGDALVLQNRYGSASTQLKYSSHDGTFSEKRHFATDYMKEVLNYLEGEDVLLTLAPARDPKGTLSSGYTAHFEEGNEQIVLYGWNENELNEIDSDKEEVEEV